MRFKPLWNVIFIFKQFFKIYFKTKKYFLDFNNTSITVRSSYKKWCLCFLWTAKLILLAPYNLFTRFQRNDKITKQKIDHTCYTYTSWMFYFGMINVHILKIVKFLKSKICGTLSFSTQLEKRICNLKSGWLCILFFPVIRCFSVTFHSENLAYVEKTKVF